MNVKKLYNLADRHKNFNQKIVEKLQQQSIAEIENQTTKESRTVYNWNRQVAGCYQRSRAFSRLKISEHSIVYGYIEPEHYVEDMVAEWFLSRFPTFTIIISSPRGTFVVSRHTPIKRYDELLEPVVKQYEKTLPKSKILTELSEFKEDDFWENYYDSQFIKERKNTKYFLKNIPKKFHGWDSLTLERNKFGKNKKIAEFS